MTAPGGYTYPPPTSGQSAEPYRGSPTGSNNSLPPLNLPPFRAIDGRSPTAQQQQQQQQGHGAKQSPSGQPTSGQNAMGSPLAPHVNQYYQAQQSLPPPPPHMGGSDPHNAHRYAIAAANDSRLVSGGRHKKEIKRRTKTGCLTCRRRRIKCDETHPTCKNCIKSKRDCLGYDPIFKQQPGPAAIQPAPSSAPSMNPLTTTSSAYPPPPQGYMPASSQPFAPSLTAGAASPDSSAGHFDYSAAIDPALEAAGSSQMQVHSSLYDGSHESKLGAKPTKIEDLLDVGGVPPPDHKPLSPLPPSIFDAIGNLYNGTYAIAIDKFLETHWFATRGLTHLLADQNLCERYAHLIQRFESRVANLADYRQLMLTQSLEAHVIWQTMQLCRQVSAKSASGSANYIEINEGVHDAAKRLEVFETLITNQYLDGEPLPSINQPTGPQNGRMMETTNKFREFEFWRLISKFLTIRDDEAAAANHLDDILAELRKLLDSRENRDVMYSIAIARHIGQRMAEGSKPLGLGDRGGELNNDENDPRNKLKVARTFVESEAGGRGTTQVAQRMCAMAIRSWGNR